MPWDANLARFRLQDLARDAEGVEPCSKEVILGYIAFVRGVVDEKAPGLDLAAESGFQWLPCDKLELQLYSLRHLQPHTGEPMERLGTRAGVDVDWVFGG